MEVENGNWIMSSDFLIEGPNFMHLSLFWLLVGENYGGFDPSSMPLGGVFAL